MNAKLKSDIVQGIQRLGKNAEEIEFRKLFRDLQPIVITLSVNL